MTEPNRERLRGTFTEDADLYDRIRPGYPPRMFDDLAELAGLAGPAAPHPGPRMLEIGCGTGQATLPLAARGYRITAVELGAELAAVARRKLVGFPRARVVVGAFEEWPLPAEPFDVVLAATSFHWIDPAVRVAKAADALRPGGTLATVSTHHVAGGSASFFARVQDCYERFDPATPPGLRLPSAADIPEDGGELAASGRFAPALFRRYARELTYSAQEYLDLLRTYSGHRALPAAARDGLLECIGDLIDRRYGGTVTKRYLTQLRVAHRGA
ncbi:class I SAM-dependent methyltransferase [Streptomyces noursei]|uniref:class I SAM-dependent methyltransferase n=1 Tax=Streptomyces noursei TaxID=1971 RepID=UPI0023B7CC46|nr:class I SAM-dependent methyltransferase [Streptomyces noursei]